MLIADDVLALNSLKHLSYYRLRGYWLIFEEKNGLHQFEKGTTFEAVLNIYEFDRKLRLLCIDAIERIEVSLRTVWAYYFSKFEGSSHPYLNHKYSSSVSDYSHNLSAAIKVVTESKELYIKHYKNKYTSPDAPPIWAICEVLSLGQLSRWYKILRPIKLRSAIAKEYGLDQQVLESFIHHLTYIRNICAHHSRLWNRDLTVLATLPKIKKTSLLALAVNQNEIFTRKTYNTLCYIQHFMLIIDPKRKWGDQLKSLVDIHRIDVLKMGFRENWKSLELWQ